MRETFKKEIEYALKKRQYDENYDRIDKIGYWKKGFVSVIVLDNFIHIKHNYERNAVSVKIFYNKDALLEELKYFERI